MTITERIQSQVELVGQHAQHGDETVQVKKEDLVRLVTWLKKDPETQFDFLVDITAVDYLTYPEHKATRFEVVYHLYSMTKRHRLRIKVAVDMPHPEVDTLTGLWKTADWFEREVWDQYGIKFKGHPNLKRLLNHMEFVGHPLRKDYPIRRRQPLSTNDTLLDEMEARLKAKGLKA